MEPRSPVLFVNPSSGGGKAARAGLAEHARRKNIDVVDLRRGQSLAELVRRAVARGADTLGIAGGDGSLGVVAAAAMAHGLPLVCVPAGTRNHFALDLGIDPHDLIGSLEAFEGGVERRVDVSEVNGRLFLNNVSLGVYGDAVRHAAYRDAKLRTLLTTAVEGLGPSAAVPELHVVDEMGGEHRSPAVLLVSNNPYALDRPLASATRPVLDSGRLGIVVVDRPQPGRRGWRAWSAPSFEVSAPKRLHAGVDGEAAGLDPPLLFVIRPAALRVRVASRHPGIG
jgi:diacylglycerol kinase family enzyme